MARAAAKRLEGQSAAMSGSAQAGPQGRGTRIPAVGQCAHQNDQAAGASRHARLNGWSEKVRHCRQAGPEGPRWMQMQKCRGSARGQPPALTTSSAGAAAAGLAHFHGTFASASISALPGLLVCSAGPFRSTRSALRVGLRLPPGRSGGRIGPRLVSLSLALAALLARNRSWLRTGLPAAWLLPLPLRPEHTR